MEQKPCALVVDDNADNRNGCKKLLSALGYQVIDAPDGLVALEILKQAVVPFNLMVLDLRMPVMDGAAVLEHLAKMHAHDRMYVIVSTANPQMIAKLNKRYDYTAPKPLDVESFVELVNKVQSAGERSSETRTDVVGQGNGALL